MPDPAPDLASGSAPPTLPTGALVALATPVTKDGYLDPAGLERLVAHTVGGGVSGVCPVGSTGEGPRLSMPMRLEVTRRVAPLLPAGIALLPAVGMTSVHDAQHELHALGELGIRAALVALPSYYPLAATEVMPFYERLADVSPVPLVLYNIPMFTKEPIPVATVAALARHPRVVGIKDSSRDMEYLTQILAAVPADADFRVYTGTDTLLLASLVSGAAGTIAASANLVPELGVAVYDAVASGDIARARKAQERLAAVVFACRRGSAPAGWKAALAERGICGPDPVAPAQALEPGGRAQLTSELRDLGVL